MGPRDGALRLVEDPSAGFAGREEEIIRRLLEAAPDAGRHHPPPHPAARPGDDAAVIAEGEVVTVDLMVEGVHWDERCAPEDLGWKLVAVNASDIGAMGCRPTWALLGLSLPASRSGDWLTAFARGLGEGLRHVGAELVGGDTTGSRGPVALSLTMAGRGPRPVGRSGARAGEDLWVSGALGMAAAGFLDDEPAGLRWWRRPRPPVELGARLGEEGLVSAMMDLSDGLRRDLDRLCRASALGAEVEAASLPLHPPLGALPREAGLARAVSFGEDYQLLFSAGADRRARILALGEELEVAVHRIGRLVERPGARLDGGGWPAPLFEHFPPPG